jgi:hypothetical protein
MKAVIRIGVILCLTWVTAYGTMMRYLEVEELAKLSTDVFRGQVVSMETYWNPGRTRIYTGVRVRIFEPMKGATRRDQIVTVTQLGGEIDGVRMDYAGRPVFEPGEPVILFTERGRNGDYIVVGLKQGKMRVEGARAKREFSGITFIDRDRTGSERGRSIAEATDLSMAELRTRIARAR